MNLGLTASAGLSTVVAGVGELEPALIDIDAETLRPVSAEHIGPYFTVLPAGPIPPNPQALLSGVAMRETVRRARAMADVVLLDTAPVGAVNDVVALAELVDGIALLTRLRHTRRDALQRALRVLEHLDAPVLGLVLTDARHTADAYYGYDRVETPAGA